MSSNRQSFMGALVFAAKLIFEFLVKKKQIFHTKQDFNIKFYTRESISSVKLDSPGTWIGGRGRSDCVVSSHKRS